jgi:hypothetical protein
MASIGWDYNEVTRLGSELEEIAGLCLDFEDTLTLDRESDFVVDVMVLFVEFFEDGIKLRCFWLESDQINTLVASLCLKLVHLGPVNFEDILIPSPLSCPKSPTFIGNAVGA